MADKKVIGIIGRKGSGKDALANYLRDKYEFKKLSVGDLVRREAEEEGISKSRENLENISQKEMTEQDESVFIRRIADQISESDTEKFVVSGIRTPNDVDHLKKRFNGNFKLVNIHVSSPWVRFERIQKRNDPRDPDQFEEFKANDDREEELFNISEAENRADVEVNNEGTFELFIKHIEDDVVDPLIREKTPQEEDDLFV